MPIMDVGLLRLYIYKISVLLEKESSLWGKKAVCKHVLRLLFTNNMELGHLYDRANAYY